MPSFSPFDDHIKGIIAAFYSRPRPLRRCQKCVSQKTKNLFFPRTCLMHGSSRLAPIPNTASPVRLSLLELLLLTQYLDG